jgi:aryl-alcohol dehydrogenase-like predicted oxidoreductase
MQANNKSMETFTAHIQNQLSDILESLAPNVDLAEVKPTLALLVEEIGIRDAGVSERTAERIDDILNTYQQSLSAAYERAKAELFRLVAQLEYPSRQ